MSCSGHPDLDSWATYSIGDTLMYASVKGQSESYTLRSIVGSGAYEETDFGDTEDIRCGSLVTYLFEASGVDHYISQVYSVIDREGVALADQPLYVEIASVATPDSIPESSGLLSLLGK